MLIKKRYILEFSLILLIISFFIPRKVIGNFAYFDFMLVIFFFIYIGIGGKFYLNKKIINFILFLNLIVVYPLAYSIFSISPKESFLYVIQYFFAFTLIPIFFYLLKKNNLLYYFLKTYLYVFLIISFFYLIFIYLFFTKGIDALIIFSTFAGSKRFIFGQGNPNDIYIYTFLALFSLIYINKNKVVSLKYKSYIIFLGLTTFSKSVFLATMIYLFKYYKKMILLLIILFLILIKVYENNEYILMASRIIDLSQYSVSDSGNQGRIEMFLGALEYGFQNPFRPLTFVSQMIPVDYNKFIINTHNIFGSIIANFSIVSLLIFIIILIYFSYKIIINHKTNKIATLFLLMSFLIMQFQPLQNARFFWFPFLLYLMLSLNILGENHENKIFIERKNNN